MTTRTDYPQSSHPTVRETLEDSQSRVNSHLAQPPSDAPGVSQATEKVNDAVTKGSASGIEGGKAVEAPVGDGRKFKDPSERDPTGLPGPNPSNR